MYQEMHDALVAPARRGPAFASAPAPVPATTEATGPAYLYVKDVGLVTFGVDGKVTQQTLELQHVGGLAVAADGAVIVGPITCTGCSRAGGAHRRRRFTIRLFRRATRSRPRRQALGRKCH